MCNFRVKVDLSNFYEDARKLSYIYVDKNTISHVLHLHERIKRVFTINRPFYLTSSDGIYLPLNEDIKIINQEETIVALAGDVNPNCLTVWKETGVRPNGNPLPTIEVAKNLEEISKQLSAKDRTVKSNVNHHNVNNHVKNDSIVGSSNSYTFVCNNEKKIDDCNGSIAASGDFENQTETSSDQEIDQETTKNDINSDVDLIPQKKRKRIRKRKPKNSKNSTENVNGISSRNLSEMSSRFCSSFTTPAHVKLRSSTISQPRHFKFTWDNDNDVKLEAKNATSTAEIPALKTLLDLKKSPFPVSFFGQKAKISPVKVEPKINGDHQTSTEDNKVSESIDNANAVEEIDFKTINPLDYPTFNEEFLVDDVMAFRTLKMSSDYTPTVSGYIIAKVTSKPAEKDSYTFEIISGEDHLKDPEGKFSLPTEEEQPKDLENPENQTRIHYMAANELIEPRLIHRKNP